MPNSRGLVVIHVDGVGYDYMQKALARGYIPFVKNLLASEDYEILPYRCGIPSTTPFVQAGVLFGDNAEIPAFRWWDKQAGLLIAFGEDSSFKYVAHKYFHHCESLVAGGACIAACYPADAMDTFRLGYRERDSSLPQFSHNVRRLLIRRFVNPFNLIEWFLHGVWQIIKGNRDYWLARLRGQRAEPRYVISDILEEIFLHQLTRAAVIEAMEHNYPSIFAAFYAYDETAHAYGPESDYSFRILRDIDDTIRRVGESRAPSARKRLSRALPNNGAITAEPRDYELVVLSDHGHIVTVPFDEKYGRPFGELVAEWLPTYVIEEYRGKHLTPRGALDGHVVLAYSGGLAHMYFKDLSWRLERHEIEQRFPGLIAQIARTPGIDFILLRDRSANVIVTAGGEMTFDARGSLSRQAREFLARFDNPEIVASQLHHLNLFERAGDLILVGKYENGVQINFEHQVGGHGSLGGEQLHPFILAKREWDFNTESVYNAKDLHPMLARLRTELER
jgi:hypothetical protein